MVNLGYYQPAQVSGVVFHDVNANGVQDGGETGISGAMVRLGTAQVTTAASGAYALAGRPGTAQLTLLTVSGYVQTSPGSGVYPLTLQSAQVVAGKNFGLIHPAYVSGSLFDDLNGNLVREAGEEPPPGWRILIDGNGNGVADPKGSVATSGPKASIEFAGTRTLPGGAVITVPSENDSPAQVVAPGTSVRAAHVTMNVTATDMASLTAYLVLPNDQRVLLGGGEDGLNGKTFDVTSIAGTMAQGTWKLEILNGNLTSGGTIDSWSMIVDLQEAEAFGDVAGRFNATPLLPGSYLVKLLPLPGYTQTKPVAGIPYVVNLAEGQVVESQDFAVHDFVAPRVVSAVFDPNGPQYLTVTFSEGVRASLDGTELTVLDSSGASVPLFFVGAGGNQAVWQPGPLGRKFADGNYHAILSAAGVQDPSANHLDGNGDGTGGDDYAFDFFQLKGDANLDRKVDGADFKIVIGNIGKTQQHWADGDFNADGKVNFVDFQALELAFGRSLPAPTLLAAPSMAAVAAEARKLVREAPTLVSEPPARHKATRR